MAALSFLSSLLLALAATANPVIIPRAPVSVSLLKELNVTSGHQLVASGRERAQALKTKALRSPGTVAAANLSEPVINEAVIYIAEVGVGSPPTTYNLIVDTGSSNTWVGAVTAYEPTSSSQSTGDIVQVTYGSGFFIGLEYIDTVTLTDELVIPEQSIGAAFLASGFSPYDGILGIGPTELTSGTLLTSSEEIPTVTDNLYNNGVISDWSVGISFAPTTSEEVQNGVLTFGGVDDSLYTGDINVFPKTTTEPATHYWGYDQTVSYGSQEILPLTAGITDTGTTLLYLATDAYDAYVSSTGATLDSTTGLLSISASQFDALESLFFDINGVTYELIPDAQLWPTALNEAIGGSADSLYLVVSDLGSSSGEGLDFINGYAFLERFYSVYDSANAQLGFAETNFTKATVNYQ
ncbi:acid protease [Schizophyllum commune Tattone D]|nr:acid protease [Schizophyllum commune Tattone D]